MENESQQNFGLKSTTTVTISLPSADSTAHPDPIPEEQPEPIVNETTMRRLLAKERDSCVIQLKNMKAAAENFQEVITEKEKTLQNLKVSNMLLKQSMRPMDVKIQAAKKAAEDKRVTELELLRQKVAESEENEKRFDEAVSDYKKKIEGKNATLVAHRKNMAAECDALKRLYATEVENTKASLKELNKAHKLALAEQAKMAELKKFQLEKVELLKQECQQMYSQFEKIGVERKALVKQVKEIDARLIEIEQLAKMERESPALLKIEDNKRNMALRTKQISDASMLRGQKKQALASQSTKLANLVQERDLLIEERKALEKLFKEKLDDLNSISAEIERKQGELENIKKRTEEFETEMKKKLEEARRKSESYSAELMREMEGVRRESVHFANQVEERKRNEMLQKERNKEELREELKTLDEMMEALMQGHKLELEGKQRYYERVERDLEVFGKGEKEGNEFEINLITSSIEKLGVKRNTAEAEFEEQQAELKEEIEAVKRQLVIAKKAVEAGKVIAENTSRAEQAREAVRAVEREINAKKAKYFEMHKEAYNFKNDMNQKGMQTEFDPEAVMMSQPIEDFSDEQIALREASDYERAMPQLDGPVTKWHEQRANGEVLEQVSVAGASGKFTKQTLSKVATSSNPANYQVETQQMETTLPGFDANSDFTTKIKKVVYSGKGIDMNVLNEAKRILVVHQNGVTREADETEQEFQMRQVLVKRADELQKMAQNLNFLENSMPNSAALKPKEKAAVAEIASAQAVFSQITQRLARNQHQMVENLSDTLTQIEAELAHDAEEISKMKSGNRKTAVRKQGVGKK